MKGEGRGDTMPHRQLWVNSVGYKTKLKKPPCEKGAWRAEEGGLGGREIKEKSGGELNHNHKHTKLSKNKFKKRKNGVCFISQNKTWKKRYRKRY